MATSEGEKEEVDVTAFVKRGKIKMTSAYNLFSPDFNKSGNLKHIPLIRLSFYSVLILYTQRKQVESPSKNELS